MVAIFQRREIYQGMVLMEAWQVIPATAYSSVLGGIRERVFQFALDIERLDPAAGEAAPNERPLAEPQITQIFHQNFFGNNTTLAVGGRDVTQTVSAVPLDVDGLVAALQELGIDKDEQEILVEAVRSDQQDGGPRPADARLDRTLAWWNRPAREWRGDWHRDRPHHEAAAPFLSWGRVGGDAQRLIVLVGAFAALTHSDSQMSRAG